MHASHRELPSRQVYLADGVETSTVKEGSFRMVRLDKHAARDRCRFAASQGRLDIRTAYIDCDLFVVICPDTPREATPTSPKER